MFKLIDTGVITMTQKPPQKKFTIRELSQAAGISARNIRYYIARNLLQGPVPAGRNSFYTQAQLNRLREIQSLKSNGLFLEEIALKDAESAPPSKLPEPEAALIFKVSDDVHIHVRHDISPWRMNRIKRAISEFIKKT